jgi:hypothetical protein
MFLECSKEWGILIFKGGVYIFAFVQIGFS